MNKFVFTALTVVLIIALSACDDPEEFDTWPDGSILWLAGTYADTALSWSPFGDVLFFSTYADGATRLFGTDGINAPEERTFTSMDEFMGSLGAWNGEAGRIVYTALNADSMRSQIRSIAGNDIYVTVHINDSLLNAFPTYNVAGDSILYCCDVTGNWRLYQIQHLHTPDSTEAPLLLPGFPEGDILRPSYSPDTGNWILFQHRASSSDDWDIMIAHHDGSGQRIIAENSAEDFQPTWGPNDQWVAFSSNRTGNYEIYLADVDNDTLIQLTDDPALDQYPAWNPNYEWIAFSSDRYSGDWDLDIFAIDEPDLP
ncbi:MAG: PD40 domain-containing protein [Candidatus Sabulitectum sp.]|nr:PD40 domain-containing protein [Candidatus Sabulitectum sp.]